MKRLLLPALFVFAAAPTTGAPPAAEIRGQYVEARTCDVFTGACFANADTGLTGNETECSPPLAKGVSAKAAMASEHTYAGKELNETWSDSDRRGAYVGAFGAR